MRYAIDFRSLIFFLVPMLLKIIMRWNNCNDFVMIFVFLLFDPSVANLTIELRLFVFIYVIIEKWFSPYLFILLILIHSSTSFCIITAEGNPSFLFFKQPLTLFKFHPFAKVFIRITTLYPSYFYLLNCPDFLLLLDCHFNMLSTNNFQIACLIC